MLVLESVYFSYREPLLRGVNLIVEKGSRIAIMGKSGAGKTTLLKIMAGLLAPQKGRVARGFRAVSYIPQNAGLVETATALENVLYATLSAKGIFLGLWDAALREKAEKVVESVGLGHKKNVIVSRLSGGERQRVAIARALMQGAELILADEPISNLDYENAVSVLRILTNQPGISVVAVMHDVDLAMEYFSRGYELRNGVLVELW
ncbi:ATP-binding cassette domain-containing protein [Pyrobaculum sp.]|uniref:ATP-binding cassette domain-containing protein n=1 Tax=Pyrobaculum sp. TaxID=2004705 RepID=UPI0031783878